MVLSRKMKWMLAQRMVRYSDAHTPPPPPLMGGQFRRESMPELCLEAHGLWCLYLDPTTLLPHGLRGLCPENQYLICLQHQMRHSVAYINAGIFKEHIVCWNLCNSSPQPFWHQGPVSWKIIFPWTGVKGLVLRWLKHSHSLCIYFYHYYMGPPTASGIRSWRLGTLLLQPPMTPAAFLLCSPSAVTPWSLTPRYVRISTWLTSSVVS